jgi:PAS domain S-box-containing protein
MRAEAPDLFQAIVEQVSDAIIFADRKGVIRLWNPGAQTLFGYSAEEAVGKSLDLIIPDRLRLGGYGRAARKGPERPRPSAQGQAVHRAG